LQVLLQTFHPEFWQTFIDRLVMNLSVYWVTLTVKKVHGTSHTTPVHSLLKKIAQPIYYNNQPPNCIYL